MEYSFRDTQKNNIRKHAAPTLKNGEIDKRSILGKIKGLTLLWNALLHINKSKFSAYQVCHIVILGTHGIHKFSSKAKVTWPTFYDLLSLYNAKIIELNSPLFFIMLFYNACVISKQLYRKYMCLHYNLEWSVIRGGDCVQVMDFRNAYINHKVS